jgi:hypothetical protein
MGLGREFAKGAGAVAMEGLVLTGCDAEMHGDPAGANAFDGIMNGQVARFSEGFAETGFESVHDHVDIGVAVGVKIGDAEEFLKEGLLGPLEVEKIAGVMEDAEGIEFIKENGGSVSVSFGHVE